MRSDVLTNFVDTCHHTDINLAFEIFYGILLKLTNSSRTCLLYIHTPESVGVHINQPNFSVQKMFLQLLNLPWSFS